MLNKDISDLNCYPTGMEQEQQRTNEPEEGEIVDDYELISSDEELCMRQRIRELEEENAEIEQIAVISRSYDIDRAARIPTDVSSISSTEFKTPKKRKRHKNKEHKKKSCYHHHSHSNAHYRHHAGAGGSGTVHAEKRSTRSRKTRCKRREKLLSKKQQRMSYKDLRDNINIDSSDSMKSSLSSLSLSDSDCSTRNISTEDIRDENEYYHRSEIRDTLRLAVARPRKNSTRQSGHNVDLKERLLRKDLEFTGNQFSNTTNAKYIPNSHTFKEEERNAEDDDDDDDVVICEPESNIQCVPDDSSDSLEEKELRLIALKSAVLKKHMERKKRNAEAAYSPTDFDEIISSCVVDSEDKLADLEVVDLDDDDSQMGCATASPIASPQLMMLEGQEDSSQMMDCKPVDMDIANSDSEDCPPAPPAVMPWNNEIASTIPYPPYPPADFHNGPYPPYGIYMPDFNTTALNPPPPGVDDYDEMKNQITFDGKNHNMEAQDMDVENDDFEPIETYPTTAIKNEDSTSITQELKLNSNTVSLHSNPMDEETQEEEEEQALRALLLAKFNSPKNQKKNSNNQVQPAVEVDKENPTDLEEKKKPTEAILKEAVKRLKVVGSFKDDSHYENVPVRHQSAANASPTMWNEKLQNDYVEEIPLPPRIHMPLESTVQCLKRKVEELKSHKDFETKEIQGENFRQNNSGYSSPDKSNESIVEGQQVTNPKILDQDNIRISSPIESNCQDIRENTIPSLDEDTKRRLQKLKIEILNATVGKHMEPLLENNIENTVDSNMKNTMEKEIFSNCNINFDNTPIEESAKKEELLHKKDIITSKSKEDCLPDKIINNLDKKTKKHNTNNPITLMEISKTNSALKENNLNKNNKALDVAAGNLKTVQDPKKVVVRTVNKTLVSIKNKIIKNPETIKTMVKSNSTTDTIIKPTPTYSVLRTTKIVKPNKVINTNVDLKRKVVLIKTSEPPAPSQNPAATSNKVLKNNSPAKPNSPPPPAHLTAADTKPPADNTRLITSMDQVRHMCNVAQLVISVQNSSNESSADEWPDCDSMYKPVYEYNDISSPLSLNLESPCLTPTRSNSPAEEIEAKSNQTLKSKRSPIVYNKETVGVMATPKTQVISKSSSSVQQMGQTPVAVRHLPSAAQDEYRKLVNRMKLLENQRSKKDSTKSNTKSSSASSMNKIENDSPVTAKSTLVKQVLLRNTSNNNISGEKKPQGTIVSAAATKPHKANVLRTYESLYAKIGAGIVSNLDKSLSLVDEAKKAKINKIKLETRLKKLKAEMEMLQSLHKEEEQKISRIYPNICSTNEVISSMKQKRSKVLKAALNLGKTLKGEDYRLNNELKQTITNKSKKLATDIKMINSLKAEDIDRLLMEEAKSKTIKNCSNQEDPYSGDENIPLSKLFKNKEPAQTETNNSEPCIFKNNNEKIEENKMSNTIYSNNLESTDEPLKTDFNTVINSEINSETIDDDHPKEDTSRSSETLSPAVTGVNTEFQDKEMASREDKNSECQKQTEASDEKKDDGIQGSLDEEEDVEEAMETDSKGLLSYTSPLEHLRNMNGSMDPNGVVCPYDLMGNCEDTSCKYVHISQHEKMDKDLKNLQGQKLMGL